MEAKLNVGERLVALQLLPQEGNFVMLRVLRELTVKLALSATEISEFQVKQDGNQVSWNPKGNEPKGIELQESELSLLVDALKKLNTENKLEHRHFALYEKLVEGKP